MASEKEKIKETYMLVKIVADKGEHPNGEMWRFLW